MLQFQYQSNQNKYAKNKAAADAAAAAAASTPTASSPAASTPTASTPDASTPGRYTMSSESIRGLFEQYELNVLPDPAMNPPDSQGRRTNHKSYGINIMRQMMEFGSFYINENCTDFLTEAQNYHVDDRGRFSDPDDCIDSARYALLGCLNGWSEPWDGRSPVQRFRDARHNLKALQARTQSADVTKRVWSIDG